MRTIVLPMLTPAIIAGSIFSFSLTLGDYITVNIVGGANQMLGNLVYTNVGAANNLPLAAAIALIPIVIMIGYLTAVRRTGALENL
jgi:putative spermidine/putrescine transport system permease protein